MPAGRVAAGAWLRASLRLPPMSTRVIHTPRGVNAYIKAADGHTIVVGNFFEKHPFQPDLSRKSYVPPPPPPPLKRPPPPKAAEATADALREEAASLIREAEALEEENASSANPPLMVSASDGARLRLMVPSSESAT